MIIKASKIFLVYKQYINKALQAGSTSQKGMTPPYKVAIACISVLLTSLVLFSGYMVYENVSSVHDYFSPTDTVILRDIRTGDEWQYIDIEGDNSIVFDSSFYSKKVALDVNSDSAISIHISDSNGIVVLDESIIKPGEILNLDMLQRNTQYVVMAKANTEFALIRFY